MLTTKAYGGQNCIVGPIFPDDQAMELEKLWFVLTLNVQAASQHAAIPLNRMTEITE